MGTSTRIEPNESFGWSGRSHGRCHTFARPHRYRPRAGIRFSSLDRSTKRIVTRNKTFDLTTRDLYIYRGNTGSSLNPPPPLPPRSRIHPHPLWTGRWTRSIFACLLSFCVEPWSTRRTGVKRTLSLHSLIPFPPSHRHNSLSSFPSLYIINHHVSPRSSLQIAHPLSHPGSRWWDRRCRRRFPC